MRKYLYASLLACASLTLYAQTRPASSTSTAPTSVTANRPTSTTVASTTATKPASVTTAPSSTTAYQLGMRKYVPAEGVYAVEWQPGVDLPRASKREFIQKSSEPDSFPTYALIVINGEYTVIFPGTLVLYAFGPYDIPTGIGKKSKYRPL